MNSSVRAQAGRLVSAERARLGLTQRELADRLGVDHTYVSHLEAGRREPSLSLLGDLAHIAGKRLTVRLMAVR